MKQCNSSNLAEVVEPFLRKDFYELVEYLITSCGCSMKDVRRFRNKIWSDKPMTLKEWSDENNTIPDTRGEKFVVNLNGTDCRLSLENLSDYKCISEVNGHVLLEKRLG